MEIRALFMKLNNEVLHDCTYLILSKYSSEKIMNILNILSNVGLYEGHILFLVIIIIFRVFCPRADPSLQAQEPRLQFC